ncbi:hypothetical protein LSH36_396g01015 [Paralvinella palmiformis]|uniref:Natterin-like protein n=1 Tax=Paralvinella palmiformis TaxID=53620 RepID=A0AAD9JCI4_9ANNE|nr:hypothetical protein LSH36_396g01015 [Paralvinella palmiformis]
MPQQAADKLEPFFDVEKAVMDWGVMMCDKNARSRKQKRMRKRQFVDNDVVMDVQIDWSHLSVSNKTIWGRLTDADFTAPNQNGAASTIAPALKPVGVTATDVNVLFETDFRNETSVGQEYTMKIEKTTKSSCTTEIENGVTKGVELTASLTIGDVLEVGAGFSREVSLTKMEGETLETEVTWGAESTVAVPAGKKASAQMQVLEKQQSGEFVVLTTMIGYVTIKYMSLKDGSLVFGHSGKIDTIVRYYVDQMKKQGKKYVGIVFPDDSRVEFQTKGKCTFRYGIKQVVAVIQDKD